MNKENIKECMKALEELSRQYNYKDFEVALALFLMYGTDVLNGLNEDDLYGIFRLVNSVDSLLLDGLRESIREVVDRKIPLY